MKGIAGESGETSNEATPVNSNINGVAILEFILRFLAAGGTLGSAMAMGTTEETVPLFPQSILLNAKYSDLPMFTFFVIANSVACAYLVFSLPLSFYYIIRRAAKHSRIVLVTFDTAMLGLVTAGASAATSIVYLAHKGNANANWLSICQQLDSFCERTSGSLISSFASAFLLMLIIISSAIAISLS
ncbi:casparian strip membrane protein 2 [Gossypium australe]|uniref:CASP-like protein n=1 Tax=Gossypium australe TaxID=47621 RepID=A0A5B6URU5_9ROSI|nr:casparian strip membrane protein 2 [Gossypium australe]